jgi:hypothetical protein
MTADEYLSELRGYLEILPQIESDAALLFYKKEFEKAGSDTSVMLRLGNPYALAKRIISESADFNKSEQYKNLKKDGMTNASYVLPEADLMPQRTNAQPNIKTADIKMEYIPAEKFPETAPKIKTAYDNTPKPSAAYIPPPPGSGKIPRKGKFSHKKLILGCIAGFFILGLTLATALYVDEAWDYPGEHGPVVTHIVAEPVEYTVYNENGVSEDGASYLGMPLQTVEFTDAVDLININISNADVVIVSGDTFRVNHTENITVDFSSGFLNVTNENDGGYIKIEVPETEVRSSLTLKLSNGNVTLQDLKLLRLSLNISNGITTTLSNVNVADRADITAPYGYDLSIINSVMNDTAVNAPQTQLSFINSTFSESLTVVASPDYRTDFSNCKFTDDTLFDITYN